MAGRLRPYYTSCPTGIIGVSQGMGKVVCHVRWQKAVRTRWLTVHRHMVVRHYMAGNMWSLATHIAASRRYSCGRRLHARVRPLWSAVGRPRPPGCPLVYGWGGLLGGRYCWLKASCMGGCPPPPVCHQSGNPLKVNWPCPVNYMVRCQPVSHWHGQWWSANWLRPRY